MARVLIVGCGCRGRELAGALRSRGHAVRGTSRTEDGRGLIEAAGIEGVVADPDRAGTVLAQLSGVTVVVWLMAHAQGEQELVEALHGPRLQATLARLIDAGVRGMVYEAAGSVDRALLTRGREAVEDARVRHHMPVALIEADSRSVDPDSWVAEGVAAVDAVIAV